MFDDRRRGARDRCGQPSGICLFGHTHLPARLRDRGGSGAGAEDPGRRASHLPIAGPVLINVGSVGQPRDGDPRAAYGLLDLERTGIRLRRVVYDVKGAQDAHPQGRPAAHGWRSGSRRGDK